MARLMRIGLGLLAVFLVLFVTSAGCSTIGYYSQAISGHFKLMRGRESIEALLADPQLDDGLRVQLQTVADARRFAVEALALPDNKSYSTYVATGRQAITWNVIAAPEFSLEPKRWCFPVAGCVSYRGYFDPEEARTYADKLEEEGFDVAIGSASAYSTLGWFSDPVPDTMLRGGEYRYVATLFHELAHQLLYVKDDSSFNEAYASFVEQEGIRRWLTERGRAEEIARYEAAEARKVDFLALLKRTREKLVGLYDSGRSEAEMRTDKAAIFAAMRREYATLKTGKWGGYAGYDGWFRRELNNARLVSVATYRRYIPAFEALFEEAGRDLPTFYELAEALGKLPRDERRARMDALLAVGDDAGTS